MLRIAVPNKGSLAEAAVTMLYESGYRTRRDNKELVVVDAGSTSGVIRRGDRLAVCEEGEPIFNEKKEIIGIRTRYFALLEVVQLHPRSSKCAILEGRREDIRAGDRVVFAAGDAPLTIEPR